MTKLLILFTVLLALAGVQPARAQVDLNSAEPKALAESMTGVGLVKAEAIVAYRKANGPFARIEDLAKVKGIGTKTIEANRDAIVIVRPREPAASEHGERRTHEPGEGRERRSRTGP